MTFLDWHTAGMPAISSSVRQASPQDAAACVAIYRPYVEDTTISWETEVPSVGVMAARITAAVKAHEWLVLERASETPRKAGGEGWGVEVERQPLQWYEGALRIARDDGAD